MAQAKDRDENKTEEKHEDTVRKKKMSKDQGLEER